MEEGNIKVPKSAVLEEPHLVGRDIVEAKKSFYELARSRVKLRSSNDHYAFEQKIFGKNWKQSSAVYVIDRGHSGEENPDKWVTSLEISVNKDFFGQKNVDLIPYAVEHEIYEAWLHAKRGYSTQDPQKHFLARKRQFEMAMKDGKAEKLLEFYKQTNPLATEELEYAYHKAKNLHSAKTYEGV